MAPNRDLHQNRHITNRKNGSAKMSEESSPEHFDVVIVGAGISGIGAAYHLKQQCPEKSFVVLESLESFGGTWLTHTYPGIRSDSDLFTFGYRFKPWTGPPIATAEQILTYMGEVIDENQLAEQIRYRHSLSNASWSSETNRWTLEGARTDSGERVQFTANFLWMCQGYYRHDQGYTPTWEGMDDFHGPIIHPQTWPEDLDYKDKHVIVVGSGATAATLVPAIAGDCKHVTLLQRSPTYFIPGRNENELAEQLRTLDIDDAWIHEITRRQILHDQAEMTRLAFAEPELLKDELLAGVREYLGPDYDIDQHFTPNYQPWRQRIAFVPDGDIFKDITSGKASVVTDRIDGFTEKGILLKSGRELSADIIITATGFNMSVLGDIAFKVDGKAVNYAHTVNYRGMMFTGVPNMLWIFGYFRASWTLRVDLLGDFVCRLFKHMDQIDAKRVMARLREEDRDMRLLPWMDPENFNPGYLKRAMHLLPKRGDKPEWQHTQDYWAERKQIPAIDLEAEEFQYD